MKKAIIALVCLPALTTSGQDRPKDVRIVVLHRGIYESVETSKVPDSHIATGTRGLVKDIKLVKETTHVPAVIGAEFGFEYEIDGAEEGQTVKIERVDIFPGDGLHNPNASGPRKSERITIESAVGNTSHVLYRLDHDWEVVPGNWVLQLWHGGKKLAEVSFTLVKADR